jgi:hypothetical protein
LKKITSDLEEQNNKHKTSLKQWEDLSKNNNDINVKQSLDFAKTIYEAFIKEPEENIKDINKGLDKLEQIKKDLETPEEKFTKLKKNFGF